MKKCKEIRTLIKEMRCERLESIIKKLNQILVGYYHYYGITDNSYSLGNFHHSMRKSLFYWLNRRSHMRSYTWTGFDEMLKQYPLAKPKIYVNIYDNC